jgi:hypothetical protein
VTLPGVSILEAMRSWQIWAPWFRDVDTWRPWRVFLAALFGLPIAEEDLALFRQCTGLDAPPPGGTNEAWLICGRRAGKSFTLALIACFLACFPDWRPLLAPGEIGTLKVIAVDRRQARTIHRYCRALISRVPVMAALIEHSSDEEIVLNNGIAIEIQTASFRSTRGYTVIAALVDEVAFLPNDEASASSDTELLAAIRPSMATVKGAMLLCSSSPYARRGELWNTYRRWHGRPGGPLVWKAPTRVMNCTVPQQVVDDETERDPARAAAEYGAEFRTDVETFISREIVEAAVVPGRYELPRVSSVNYTAFVDPSGGSSDAFSLAVCHRERPSDRVILDLLRERLPPFGPERVIKEFATVLTSCGIRQVHGDRYGGEFPREQFQKRGIRYVPSEKPKSDLYLEALPLLNSGRVELLDHQRLIGQVCALERRTARSGRDSVDHPPGSHDDTANAALGAIVVCSTAKGPLRISPQAMAWARTPDPRHSDMARRSLGPPAGFLMKTSR